MPRFKPAEYGLQFLAVELSAQLRPGSFEYALHHLIEHEIELKDSEARYKNEHEGAWAYDPRMLLKIVLLAYSRGIDKVRARRELDNCEGAWTEYPGGSPAEGG